MRTHQYLGVPRTRQVVVSVGKVRSSAQVPPHLQPLHVACVSCHQSTHIPNNPLWVSKPQELFTLSHGALQAHTLVTTHPIYFPERAEEHRALRCIIQVTPVIVVAPHTCGVTIDILQAASNAATHRLREFRLEEDIAVTWLELERGPIAFRSCEVT